MIPKQLKNAGFVLLKKGSKIPYEKGWQSNFKTYDEANTNLQKGLNYGIVCEQGDIRVLDTDNPKLTKYALESLPTTFSVKTGGGGIHFYYKIKDMPKKIVLQKGETHYGELQGPRTQVVGPGSTHPNGNKYEILEDKPIKKITKEEILFLLKDYYEPEISKIYTNNSDKVELSEVLSTSGLKQQGNEYQGAHPIHGSTGGMNFTSNLSKGVWHCFRHNTGGDGWYWLAVQEGIIRCEDCKPGTLRGSQFIEVKQKAINQGYIKQTKNNLQAALEEFTNHISIAENFYKHQPIYYDKTKIWWLWDWDNNKWVIVDETDLLISITDHLDKIFVKGHQKSTIMEALRQVGRRNKPRSIKKTWIQFKNIMIDVNTQEEIFPGPDYFAINPIPWGVADIQETPILDKLFEEWVGKKEVQLLYEILAYSMLPDYPINRMFILNGDGRNGKSTFLKILTKFIGEYNTTTTELDLFIKNSFERASLYKKLVCLMGETNYNELKNTGIIKRLTGEDKTKFEFKGKDAIEDYNYAKIIIATNNIPVTLDESDGFFSRMIVIDFPNTFNSKRDIMKEISDEEFENLGNKCVKILKKLLKKREFSNEGSIEYKRLRYIERSNELAKYIREKTIEEFGSSLDKDDFREEFFGWCKKNNIHGWSAKRIGSYMTRTFVQKQIRNEDGEYVRKYVGLRWK